jgi:hypothetical protein
LDKVSDELLLESVPMLAVEGNSVVHPLQLGCHLTLTPFPTVNFVPKTNGTNTAKSKVHPRDGLTF